jgi:hypothetical protein
MKGREIIWCVSGRRGGGIYRCSWGLDFRKGKTEDDRRERKLRVTNDDVPWPMGGNREHGLDRE